MNILVTGANGFIGKNLCAQLKNIRDGKDKSFGGICIDAIFEYDVDTDFDLLDHYCQRANFVFNLAGVNRPIDQSEFMVGNFDFASKLLETLKKHRNVCPIMISSSTQATLENPYGRSKKAGEDLLFKYSQETGAKVFAYRFPNVFGKWCRPNYNSAVSTFCNNIANGKPVEISDRANVVNLVYIDDLVSEMMKALKGAETRTGDYCNVPVVYSVSLGQIVDLLYSFRESRESLDVSNMGDAFTKKLYATYISYLPEDGFSYKLKMNVDERGSFTEILRTADRGQFSVNIIKPNITKGNHWHHTKIEKFVVVKGKGVIRFKKIAEKDAKVLEYFVSGDKMEVIDIPAGYTHNIENIGDVDMITFIWVNEPFDANKPDTFFEPISNIIRN